MLHADKGYDCARCRVHLLLCSIQVRIARRGAECNDRPGCHRWVVERTHAGGLAFGKPRVRFARRIDTRIALLVLACGVICVRARKTFCQALLAETSR